MGIGAVGLAGLLAACGGDDEDAGDAGTPGADSGDTPAGDMNPTDEEDDSPEPEPEPEPEETATDETTQALAAAGDVPVGGGLILNGPGVVITQPTEGEFTAFSTTCTHQGCAVTEVANGLITCPCHGSQFSMADGSVEQGPAERALDEVAIVVEGDQILAG